jgi:hypothetical protein
MSSLDQWLKSGKYLPRFMRDFHDQKDLFKTIHELVRPCDATERISWVDAQIYTIDVFLRFMARRGYTLQRSQAKQEFLDIHRTIADQTKRRDEAFSAALDAIFAPKEPTTDAGTKENL